jgi:hypothetical protein
MAKAPVENHRVILNTIRELRKDIKYRAERGYRREEARYALHALAMMIKRMKVGKDHGRVAREWRRLCEEVWPSDNGPRQRWWWVDESIKAQVPGK